jgi:hypothetical protein
MNPVSSSVSAVIILTKNISSSAASRSNHDSSGVLHSHEPHSHFLLWCSPC